MWRPKPKRARVDPSRPQGWAVDDRTGFIVNHVDLQWQHEWSGFQLINQRILTVEPYLDKPQEQLRSIVLPMDPPPIMNARIENYTVDELPSYRITMNGRLRVLSGSPPAYSLRITTP